MGESTQHIIIKLTRPQLLLLLLLSCILIISNSQALEHPKRLILNNNDNETPKIISKHSDDNSENSSDDSEILKKNKSTIILPRPPFEEIEFSLKNVSNDLNTKDNLNSTGSVINSEDEKEVATNGIISCDLGDDTILEAKESIAVCSANSENWHIYCAGKLLEAVNYHQLLEENDSKEFVDRPLKKNASIVIEEFDKLFGENVSVHDIPKQNLSKFLEENFDHAGGELKECTPEDWTPVPAELERIKDDTLRSWAMELNTIWKDLCRVIPEEIKDTRDRHSLIYVKNPFIIPGGRFREFYYWDAYWIIKGLIVSGMTTSVRLMIENFLDIVDKFGFVPNGGRIYYAKRSQPPFLTMMVYEYFEATHDYDFIKKALPILEKFWTNERGIEVPIGDKTYRMFQYRVGCNVPRPESFCEDVRLVKQKTKVEDKRQIWRDLSSAAESGWDFSSRWMKNPEKPKLVDIETTNIVPVDLNAYICGNYEILSHLYLQLENNSKAFEYHTKHYEFRENFQKVFFVQHDRETAGWYDYNLRKKDHNKNFYATIAIPLFTRCYHSIDLQQSERIFRTMETAGVFKEPGGIPTSMINSHQQWDYPNGWPPLNHMIIEGLRRSDNKLMQKKAFWLATKWVLSNYRVYRNDSPKGKMWEKYEVNKFKPNKGVGGEYQVQAGFGWTNGVILDLLTTFGDRIEFKNDLEMNPNAVAKEVISNEPPNLPDVGGGNLQQNNTLQQNQTIDTRESSLLHQGSSSNGSRMTLSLTFLCLCTLISILVKFYTL
ncbi:unnamed protein product [Meloidogyne enterolobii]|uniref:Uncharacterized protein n=1 Tax=Meloidogyne enterolobii TaxID=390850 RepID=A0ACB1AC21_MELEN